MLSNFYAICFVNYHDEDSDEPFASGSFLRSSSTRCFKEILKNAAWPPSTPPDFELAVAPHNDFKVCGVLFHFDKPYPLHESRMAEVKAFCEAQEH